MNTVCCGKCGSLNIVSTTNGGYYCIDCKNFLTDVSTYGVSPVSTYSINNNILTIDVDSVVLRKDTLTVTLDRVNVDNLRAIEINGATFCKAR